MHVFGKGKFELLTLTETKLKRNGKVSWCGVNGIIASVRRWKELLNDMWPSTVIDFYCVSIRILWIKFKFSRVKVFVVVGYGSNEGDGEEWDKFWNDMDMILDRVGNVINTDET